MPPTFTPYESRKIDSAFSLGAGAGYQFNSWFRADVTAEHRFDARMRGYNRNPGLAAGLIESRAEFSATTVLANAYLDLGTWYRMTPYVGAGLGFSAKSLRSSEMRSGATSLGILQGSHTRTDFAWALMAGVGVEMGHNTVLDLNYRYLHLGAAGTKPGSGVVSTGSRTDRQPRIPCRPALVFRSLMQSRIPAYQKLRLTGHDQENGGSSPHHARGKTMTKVLAASASAAIMLAGLGTFAPNPAVAADLFGPLRGTHSSMPQLTPVHVWDGGYFGGFAGMTNLRATPRSGFREFLDHELRLNAFANNTGIGNWISLPSKRNQGTSFGFFAGYNFQFDEAVLGFEFDYTRGKQHGHRS